MARIECRILSQILLDLEITTQIYFVQKQFLLLSNQAVPILFFLF